MDKTSKASSSDSGNRAAHARVLACLLADLFNRYKKSSTHNNKRSQVVVAIKQEVFGQFGKRPAPSELPGAVGMSVLDDVGNSNSNSNNANNANGDDGDRPRRSPAASPPQQQQKSRERERDREQPRPSRGDRDKRDQQRDEQQQQQQREQQSRDRGREQRQSSAQRNRQHVSIEDDQQGNSPSNSVPSVRSQQQTGQQQQRAIQPTRSTSTEERPRGRGGRRGPDDLSDSS